MFITRHRVVKTTGNEKSALNARGIATDAGKLTRDGPFAANGFIERQLPSNLGAESNLVTHLGIGEYEDMPTMQHHLRGRLPVLPSGWEHAYKRERGTGNADC